MNNIITEYQLISEQEQLSIRAIAESELEFPVDFDNAWPWVGFTRKDSAKDLLVKNFERGLDFSSEYRKTPQGGRPTEIIFLTNDCFKQFCMMASTQKGKEVRKYFLQCEKELKALKAQPVSQPTPLLETEKHLAMAPMIEKMLLSRGCDERIAPQVAFKAVGTIHPELDPYLKVAAKELGFLAAKKENQLNPTGLAEVINRKLGTDIKANRVNKLLEQLGYQITAITRKGSKENKGWALTEAGKKFGSNVPFTAEHSSHSGFCITWKESVVEELIPLIQDKAA